MCVTVAAPVRLPTATLLEPLFHALAPFYSRGMDLDRVSAPLPVPWTAIYSKRDGILAWESCVTADGNGQCHAVEAPHIMMARNPDALRIIVDATGASCLSDATAAWIFRPASPMPKPMQGNAAANHAAIRADAAGPPEAIAGAVLTVRLDAIQENWRRLAAKAAPAECGAAIKGDAYGLGVGPVAKALWAGGLPHILRRPPHGRRRIACASAARGDHLRARRPVSRPGRILCERGSAPRPHRP